MKNLRILVVYPLYGGSLPIAQYAMQALQDLGHVVDYFDASLFNDAHYALRTLQVTGQRLNELETNFVNILAEAVYAKVESFMPDLVLALAQAPLTKQVLNRLRRDKVTTAMWFVEDYRVFTYWRAFAEFYDFFFVIQKDDFFSFLAQISGTKAYYLPVAALPSLHKKIELSEEEQEYYGSDLSFVGAGYPNRRLAFRQLMYYDFKIWGSDWEDELILRNHIQNKGQRVSVAESVKIYNACKININLHSSIHIDKLVSGGDFINPRTFELASIGAFQLVDKRSLMTEVFEDEELATFDSLEDLTEKIDYYLARPEERQRIAERTRFVVREMHTYQHRMQDMLAYIQSEKKDFAVRTQEEIILQNLSTDLDPISKLELVDLLAKYKLPASASLADLVGRISLEKGVLSPSESAILFLNEWQKQYG